jgi:hypothetical protein
MQIEVGVQPIAAYIDPVNQPAKALRVDIAVTAGERCLPGIRRLQDVSDRDITPTGQSDLIRQPVSVTQAVPEAGDNKLLDLTCGQALDALSILDARRSGGVSQ